MSRVETAPHETYLSFSGIVRSEWSKLWSVRAPTLIVFAMVISPMVLSVIRSAAAAPPGSADFQAGASAALESIAIGALPLAFLGAVLGLICMGAEYVDDSLSVTLSAVPRRSMVVLAKALLVAGSSALAAVVGLSGAVGLACFILSAKGYADLPITDLFHSVVAIGLASGLLGMIGLGCTSVHRSSLAASIHLAAVIAFAPTLLGIAVGYDAHLITDFLPGTAVQAVATQAPGMPFTIEGAPVSSLPRWLGVLVLAGWAASYLVAALALLSTRSVAPRQISSRTHKASVPAAPSRLRGQLTISGILRSEGFKFLTLPATWWLLGLSCLATISLSVLQALRTQPSDLVAGSVSSEVLMRASVDHQVQVVVVGIGVTQLLVALLGGLAFTTEFTSRNIQPTAIAVPQRGRLFVVKVSVVIGTVIAWTFLATVLAAAVSLPLAVQRGFPISAVSYGAVCEALIRCVITSAAIAVLGCAIGALTRSAIPAIGAIVGILILSHTALGPMQDATRGTPLVWLANLHVLFPSPVQAVQNLPFGPYLWPQFREGDVLQLDANQALAVTVAWAVVAATCAFFSFRSRPI